MDQLAPKLETIESLLVSNSLPLLVQRRNGDKLLLHKSKRLPALICNHSKTQSHFILPLDNTGYFGAITEADTPTPAYQCLREAVSDKSMQGACKVLLAGDSTHAVEYVEDTKKSVNSTLRKGQLLTVSEVDQARCLKLTPSTLDLVLHCCLPPSGGSGSDSITCCRDNKRHLHIQSKQTGLYYRISDSAKDGLKSSHAYSIQDIAQHRLLPCMISRLHHNPSPRDEYPIPAVFSLLKIISCEVVFAYTLNANYHPQPGDLIELSIYSTELFAVAESAVVNTEAIRQAASPTMSIRKAIPGITLSYNDYYDITKQSKELPPPLPSRPATLKFSSTVQLTRTRSFHDKTQNQVEHSDEVLLPTRTPSQRSIIQKFGTLLKPKSSRPTVKSILDQFHAKEMEKENQHHQSKSKKSVRGLAISGPTSDSPIIDLSKPLTSSNSEKATPSNNFLHKTDTISTSSSFSLNWKSSPREAVTRATFDDLESAYETAPCSVDSTTRNSSSNRGSSGSSFYNSALPNNEGSIRSSDDPPQEPQLRVKELSDPAKRNSIRSLREAHLQVAKQLNSSYTSTDTQTSTQQTVIDTSFGHKPLGNHAPKSNASQYSVQGAKTNSSKSEVVGPPLRSYSTGANKMSDSKDHLTELRKRFSDVTLKPVVLDSSQPPGGGLSSSPSKRSSGGKALNHTEELRKRLSEVALHIDSLTDNADASWDSVDVGYLSPTRHHSKNSIVIT